MTQGFGWKKRWVMRLSCTVCGEWEQNPRLRASFDGMTKDGIPVELKAPCEKVYQEVRL